MEVNSKPFFSRPRDNSWQAYRDWVLAVTSALTGKKAENTYLEDEWKQIAAKFWSKDKEEH